jgi:hypothetical protein
VIKPAYSVSLLLSINIFVRQNVLYFPNDPCIKDWEVSAHSSIKCDDRTLQQELLTVRATGTGTVSYVQGVPLATEPGISLIILTPILTASVV